MVNIGLFFFIFFFPPFVAPFFFFFLILTFPHSPSSSSSIFSLNSTYPTARRKRKKRKLRPPVSASLLYTIKYNTHINTFIYLLPPPEKRRIRVGQSKTYPVHLFILIIKNIYQIFHHLTAISILWFLGHIHRNRDSLSLSFFFSPSLSLNANWCTIPQVCLCKHTVYMQKKNKSFDI